MIESKSTEEIRTIPCSCCAVCGGNGRTIYNSLHDRLFGASGVWNLKKCLNSKCGLLWLDPMPSDQDIWKAYRNYYTHNSTTISTKASTLKSAYVAIKHAYWATKYQYHLHSNGTMNRALGLLLYLFPLRRRQADAEVRFLPGLNRGRLLDVGCGSGDWILLMRKLGWEAEGVDFDPEAVYTASNKGLRVNCGSLEAQHYANETFDIVVLNHVIEHVYDPLGTVAECLRVLKKGGKLLIFTPNSASLGFRVFGRYWRGLESPRHLHIFSIQSMRCLVEAAGAKRALIRSQIAESVLCDSFVLWRNRNIPKTTFQRRWTDRALGRAMAMLELPFDLAQGSVGDCLMGIVIKP